MPILYAARCDTCGALYLQGSRTTCRNCLRGKKGRKRRSRGQIRCDCGEQAAAVILVKVCNPDGEITLQRMPVCKDCLAVEEETQALLDELGISHAPQPGPPRRKPRGKYKTRKALPTSRRLESHKGHPADCSSSS
jgi:hypothetical protein